LGITPVFADVDPVTQCLDPESVKSKITDKTTGIIAVHLWGRAAPVDELERVASDYGLTLLFDAAHAFGVSSGDRMVGSFGAAEILSFHATKFFNAIEGGAIVTDDDELAKRSRLMRNFGFAGEDNVVSDGTNGKMTEISAAMGLANFNGLDDLIGVNRRNYETYVECMRDLQGVTVLPVGGSGRSNYQYVVLMVGDNCPLTRDALLEVLRDNNILARRYFWPSCHKMEPYRTLYPDAGSSLPATERIAGQVIVLPSGTSVSEEDVRVIARVIADAIAA
jgi:dTDP-4-amino-4,6-dideoxygalactose transaminase